MPEPIVVVEHLSKLYQLGVIGARTLQDSLQRRWYRMRGKEHLLHEIGAKHQMIGPDHPQAGPRPNTMWALKDVTFSVEEGEVLGVIGKNGAGKSTLLKLLSRITEPTSGRALVYGRVASLLEVGTGFHPELTGRENIYLNGAILGMKKAEIARKFDEIVAFAGVELFIDTPVKRYSSGMYVRLAFAVAAHLDPEILIVDEVLSVGDAEFQQKCLGKMEDVAKGGRTVLFVSHNMPAVNRLCNRAIRLDGGSIVETDQASTVTANYLKTSQGSMAEKTWRDEKSAPGDSVARLRSVRVLQNGSVKENVDIRFPIVVEMDFQNLVDEARLLASFAIFSDQGVHLFSIADLDPVLLRIPRKSGLYRARGEIPGNLLSEGVFRVVAEVSTAHPVYQIHFLERDAAAFQVVDTGEPGSVRNGWGRNLPGALRPVCRVSIQAVDEASGFAASRRFDPAAETQVSECCAGPANKTAS